MKTPLPDYLAQVLEQCSQGDDGALADYIPQLARADPARAGIALCTTDGVVYSAGDAALDFTLQSISKPFAYALALQGHGLDAVLRKVDVEPSGEAFNELSLEKDSGRPRNPMINAGAIATHALLPGRNGEERADALKALLESLAGRTLEYDEAVYASEMETAHRNLSLAHMLRSVGILECEPRDAVSGYTRQCAIRVTAEDLARFGAALAGCGAGQLCAMARLDRRVVRQVLSVMATCGMYDAAGDWLSTVGIPAKSGVSGGILGVLPGQLGIGVLSPKLDGYGNSVRGVRMMERLSDDMGLHIMEALQTPRSSLRNPQVDVRDDIDLYELQGDIHFAQAELLLRNLQDRVAGRGPVILDIGRVSELGRVGRRMLLDAVRGIHADGAWIALVDPEGVLPDAVTSDGFRPRVFDDVHTAIEVACREN